MDKTFTTSRGVTITVMPMPAELDRLNALRLDPRFDIPVPTYSKMTALKVMETHQHNETTLDVDDPEETKANHKAWDEYIAKKKAADDAYGEIYIKSIIINGVEPSPEACQKWIAKRRFIDPADPIVQITDSLEQHYQWFLSEAFGEPADMNAILVKIIEASGAPEEVVRAAEDSFLGRVERRKETQGLTNVPRNGKILEVQSQIRKRKSRLGKVRHSSQRVR